VSHVLQWNTNAPDFNSSSNSSLSNVTVWLWSFGHSISNCIRLPALRAARTIGDSHGIWNSLIGPRDP
jgi:hypothetical protein